MKTTLTVILVTIVSLLFIRFLWSDCHFLSKVATNLKLDSVTTSKTAPADYLKLFKSSDKLVIDESNDSKRRNAVSKFYYDKKYFLEVYKMDAVSNLPVNHMIREKFVDTRMSPGMQYLEYAGDAEFAVEYLARPREKVSKVYLTLYGDSTRTIAKNDTMAYYYSKFDNFSLTNSANKAEDIYGHLKEGSEGHKTPLELLFLKRNKNLYFILLGAQDHHTTLGKDLLCNLVAAR